MFGDLPVGFLAFKGSDMGYLKKKKKRQLLGAVWNAWFGL